MTDYAIPISGVDALTAHFAEWVKYLEAKGIELEAQQAKLEARKAKSGTPASSSIPISNPRESPDGSGFLELAFGTQAKTDMASQDKSNKPSPPEESSLNLSPEPSLEPLPESSPSEEPADEIVMPAYDLGQEGKDAEKPSSSAMETPESGEAAAQTKASSDDDLA